MAFVVCASLRVKKKYLDEFMRRVKKHANNSVTRESECVAFEVSIDKSDPRRFLFYEVYVDEAAFERHMEYPFLKRHLSITAPMIEGKVELVGLYERLTAPYK